MSSYSFSGQLPNEVVFAVLRRHPSVLLSTLNQVILIMLLPWLVFIFESGFTTLFSILFLVAMTVTLPWVYLAYRRWWQSACIITNQRLVIANHDHLLDSEATDVPFEKISEVTVTVSGWRHALWRTGTVGILTTTQHELELTDIPDPYGVEKLLVSLAQQSRTAKVAPTAGTIER